MEIEENPYEDRSEQITPKEVRQYADARARVGTKVYNNGSIIASDEALPTIDWLCDVAGILEGHHRDIGNTFKNLCDCAEGRLVAATHIVDANEQKIDPALKVAAVYFVLTKRQMRNVAMVLFEEIRIQERSALYAIAPNIQDAFEALWNALKTDNVLDAIARIRKKELDRDNVRSRMPNVSRALSALKISP